MNCFDWLLQQLSSEMAQKATATTSTRAGQSTKAVPSTKVNAVSSTQSMYLADERDMAIWSVALKNRNAKSLTLNSKQIGHIPEAIACLPLLEKLYLKSNNLTSLPLYCDQLSRVRCSQCDIFSP
jgi:Leucine-rich repeat (LRR) protein